MDGTTVAASSSGLGPASCNEDGGCVQDCIFRCNYCIKLINEDAPVYMQHDLSYCSANCRRRGRSALYTRLRNLQMECLRGTGSSVSELSTAKSESSLSSSVTARTERGGGQH